MAESKPHVAFLGLGAMGHAMSLSLVRAGFPVTGYDISSRALDSFLSGAADLARDNSTASSGTKTATSPSEACASTDLVCVMVANHHHIESALLSPESGAIHSLPPGAKIIIHATVAPSYISGLASRLSSSPISRPDITLIDAPVSGGVARSKTGTLSIMASSSRNGWLDDQEVQSVLHALSDDGKNLYVIPGEVGGGEKTKAVNQVNCGVNIVGASEIVGLVAMLGGNVRSFLATIEKKGGNGRFRHDAYTWMLCDRAPRMMVTNPPMSSATAIISKDVGIILDEAKHINLQLPLISKAMAVLDDVVKKGMLGEDDSCIVKVYLGQGQADAVVKNAESEPTEGEAEEELFTKVGSAYACVQTMAAYETGVFASALGLDGVGSSDGAQSSTKRKQWVEIVGGAAGASTSFDRVIEDGMYDGSSGDYEARFTQYLTEKFEGKRRLKDLDEIIEKAVSLNYDPILLKEASIWLKSKLS